MCGTPEFVAPEVVNYDFVDSATGDDLEELEVTIGKKVYNG